MMMHDHGGGFGHHLQGKWAAFVLAAGLTAFFVRRVAIAIAAQREQIATLREQAERNSRLAALTTLAAGAAHELNSPLATIAVAAHEARLRLARSVDPTTPVVAGDLDLILQEVDRCQDILHQMAARADNAREVAAVKVADLAGKIRDTLGDRSRRVDVELTGDSHELALPSLQTVQSVVALIKNALDASPADGRVSVAVDCEPASVRIAIADRGSGIPAEVLSKVGEPFFTTKQPGAGMGLGVFLARAFVQSLGGRLDIESTLGVGTRVVVQIPRVATP
jgi:two-component system sensor histidine kinase RegB